MSSCYNGDIEQSSSVAFQN